MVRAGQCGRGRGGRRRWIRIAAAGGLLAGVGCQYPFAAPPPPQGHISGHPVPTGEEQKPTGKKLPITRHTVRAGRPSMGSVLECTVIVKDAARGPRACDAVFAAALDYERLLSSRLPSSGVTRLSDAAGRGPQPVDARLARILIESARYSRASGGAFDVTAGPLTELWRRAAQQGRAPSDAALSHALLRVGSDAVSVNSIGPTVDLERPGMRLELDGIVRGWVLDRLGEMLRQGGIRDFLLDYGGTTLLASGRPFDAPAWIADLPGLDGEPTGRVTLNGAGLAVVRTLGESVEIGGVVYGHVIDPRTGRAATRDGQAAVVAASAAEAQAWSSALAVLGREGLAEIERREGVEAHLLFETGSERVTSGWAARVSYAPIW